MASLSDILRRNSPRLSTRQALVLVGLQNDFLEPSGKLRVCESSAMISRIGSILPYFRQCADIIWVRSEYDPKARSDLCSHDVEVVVTTSEDDAGAKAEDDELSLSGSLKSDHACLRGSSGFDFPVTIKALVRGQDLQVVTRNYSAFEGTNLLTSLRSRLSTKIYICGALTNVSVYATALDAARCGIETILIKDCLAFRSKGLHDRAIAQLLDYSAASVVTTRHILHPDPTVAESSGQDSDGQLAAQFGALDVDSADSDEESPLPTSNLTRCSKAKA